VLYKSIYNLKDYIYKYLFLLFIDRQIPRSRLITDSIIIKKEKIPSISHFIEKDIEFTVSFLMEVKFYMLKRCYSTTLSQEITSRVKYDDKDSQLDDLVKIWNFDELKAFFLRMKKKLESEKCEMLKRIELHYGDGWVEKQIEGYEMK
jgi:hypothetical protein